MFIAIIGLILAYENGLKVSPWCWVLMGVDVWCRLVLAFLRAIKKGD